MSLAPALIEGAPPRSVDLIIIGAGIAGAASAFYAARAGLDVLVVERHLFVLNDVIDLSGLLGPQGGGDV